MTNNELNVIAESLVLKQSMLKTMMYATIGFCASKILLYGGVNFIKD
jgi:hypothetical protein